MSNLSISEQNRAEQDYLLEKIGHLRNRVEELDAAISRTSANMHMFREERDHLRKALEEIAEKECLNREHQGGFNCVSYLIHQENWCCVCIAKQALKED